MFPPISSTPPKKVKLTISNRQKKAIDFKGDEYDVATATTIQEIKNIVSAGFEKANKMKGVHIFRKPKRYVS